MKCDLLGNENMCKKFDPKIQCVPSDISWCDERLQTIEANEMCRYSSIFGNYFFFINDEDIESLKQGKVLCKIDEYGMFIAYREEDK